MLYSGAGVYTPSQQRPPLMPFRCTIVVHQEGPLDRTIMEDNFTEYDNRYSSAGKGNAALTTGIIGTAGVGLGLLGNLLGTPGMGWGGGCNAPSCSDNMLVNRYELGLEQANAAKDAEISLLKANTYNDQKSLELYKFFDGEVKAIRAERAAQAVVNQKTADSFALAAADLAATKRELFGQIQLEAERRCCADNSIFTYANATIYPKLVADITAGTTTTAQVLYNPIPNCGGCCSK